MSVRVFLEKISIWFGGLSEDHPHQDSWCRPIHEGFNRTKRQNRKGTLCLSWDIHLLLPSDAGLPGHQTFGLRLNYTTSSPGCLAYRQQIVGTSQPP